MKSPPACADVLTGMEHNTQQSDQIEHKRDPEAIAVSAEQLAELIRSGHGEDLNELVRHVLLDRPAA